jgi:hypothetical protein
MFYGVGDMSVNEHWALAEGYRQGRPKTQANKREWYTTSNRGNYLGLNPVITIIIVIIIIVIIIIEIDLSLGGSSPYTSTDKTNKNKIYISETIQ